MTRKRINSIDTLHYIIEFQTTAHKTFAHVIQKILNNLQCKEFIKSFELINNYLT